MTTPFSCEYWGFEKAKITVVAVDFRTILGRDLFDQLGVTNSQKPCSKTEANTVETPCVIKHPLAKEFPELISRIGKSKHRTINSTFDRNYRVTQQKARKVPIQPLFNQKQK